MSRSTARVDLKVRPDDLDEIDEAAKGAGMTRTEYMVSAALGRARGHLDARQALDVIRQALEL